MKKIIGAFVVLLAMSLTVRAAETLDLGELERSLNTLISYEYGKAEGVDLRWVEKQVTMSATDEVLRSSVEKMLLKTLSGAKTTDAKQFILRQLYAMSTEEAIPQLKGLLTDEDVSHLARLALYRIASPEAENALLWALDETSGTLRVGMINTLAEMGSAKAKDRIMNLMKDKDSQVSLAAIRAMGRLGDGDAAKALWRVRSKGQNEIQIEVDAALLSCAEKCRAAGQTQNAEKIFHKYYAKKQSPHLRVAALRGLAAMREDGGMALLKDAINGKDHDLRQNAVGIMAGMDGPGVTATLVDLAKTLPPDGQELVVRSLASRGDRSAASTVIELVDSEDKRVQLAALEALGDIGPPEAIPCLAKAAGTYKGTVRQTARMSLVRVNGKGIDAQFIEEISNGDGRTRIELIRAIGDRELGDAFGPLLGVAKKDADEGVRHGAILALGKTGQKENFDAFMGLLISPMTPDDRPVIRKGLVTFFAVMNDKRALASRLILAMEDAPDDADGVILSLLPKAATSEALEAVLARVDASSEILRDAAVRSLADWPTVEPAEVLYKIASSREDDVQSTLAFRAYVRLSTMMDDPTRAYVKALDIAQDAHEVKAVLGGLGGTDTLTALDIAEEHMNQEEYKKEATFAAVKIAGRYCWQDPDRVRPLLKDVLKETKDLRTRDEAQRVVDRLEQWKHYIFVWKGTGPYMIEGLQDGEKVLDTPFEPETKPESDRIHWDRLRCNLNGDRIDLQTAFGEVDHCCAYLTTTIQSPEAMDAKIHWSADDMIKGWFNGEPTNGGAVKLREGSNSFMVKVGNNSGLWSFNCRITAPDDTQIEGLTFEVE